MVSEHHTAVHTLTSALLGGHSTATMARECGLEIAPAYHVLALSVSPHRQERNPRLDRKVVARRKLRRLQAELATCCGESALSLLSVDGGTVLIPESTIEQDALDGLADPPEPRRPGADPGRGRGTRGPRRSPTPPTARTNCWTSCTGWTAWKASTDSTIWRWNIS